MKLFEWDICPRPDLRHGAAGYERLFLRAIAGLGHLRYAGKRLQVVHREIMHGRFSTPTETPSAS